MFGLANNNHFISEIDNFKEETIWTPQLGWSYDHSSKVAVATSNSTTKTTFYANCSGTLGIFREGASKFPNRSLINPAAWNLLPPIEKVSPLWIFSTALHPFSSVCQDLGNKLSDSVTNPICRRSSTAVNGGREIRGASGSCYVNNEQAFIEQSNVWNCGHIRCMVDLKCCYPDMQSDPRCPTNNACR